MLINKPKTLRNKHKSSTKQIKKHLYLFQELQFCQFMHKINNKVLKNCLEYNFRKMCSNNPQKIKKSHTITKTLPKNYIHDVQVTYIYHWAEIFSQFLKKN